MARIICDWDLCKHWSENGCDSGVIILKTTDIEIVDDDGKPTGDMLESLECEGFEDKEVK